MLTFTQQKEHYYIVDNQEEGKFVSKTYTHILRPKEWIVYIMPPSTFLSTSARVIYSKLLEASRCVRSLRVFNTSRRIMYYALRSVYSICDELFVQNCQREEMQMRKRANMRTCVAPEARNGGLQTIAMIIPHVNTLGQLGRNDFKWKPARTCVDVHGVNKCELYGLYFIGSE